MSITANPEAQDSLFEKGPTEHLPPNLARAALRLEFPPSYVVVGVYRLFTDKNLYGPVWDKCKHATRRGAIFGSIWVFFTFTIQKRFIERFLSNSPRIIGLSRDTMFGYKIPFGVHTYVTVIIVGSQVTHILRFFLSRNIRIARDRAWAQTVASRGKGPDFWQPYVEEWQNPPSVKSNQFVNKWLGGWFGLFVVKRILLSPLQVYPFIGSVLSAWFKALGTGQFLHRRYFEAKKMTPHQVAIFIEERKWDYRLFGFAAALLESIPIVGLIFTISNRVGAAMWAHDLEKRQHFIASERLAGRETYKGTAKKN